MTLALMESHIASLPLVARGKVRDIYRVDEERLLLVATDRLSAFDVVLPTPIPGKGRMLTEISCFWFSKLAAVLPNHLLAVSPESVVHEDERDQVAGRAVVVKSLRPLPVEAIVRGYLVGSGWQDYLASGAVCGQALPAGLKLAECLPQPLYTPSTKAAVGAHDENIDYARTVELLGPELAPQVRDAALELYRRAAEYALSRGIIIADTKFEFGVDAAGRLHLIDEALTPDSSRFWPADQYRVGENPPSFDKQYVRDWLLATGWNKRPPAPAVPPDVVERTAQKYREALSRLTGSPSAAA